MNPSASRNPIKAERPLLCAVSGMFNNDAVKLYPDRGPGKPDRWTVAGPNCPNEVWIRRASPWSDDTGYTVSHRHSGGTFPRLFAPLAFEVMDADPRWGHKPSRAATFTEAYALAVQIVRAYSIR